jgi:mono/diheme cytochrome c family protein
MMCTSLNAGCARAEAETEDLRMSFSSFRTASVVARVVFLFFLGTALFVLARNIPLANAQESKKSAAAASGAPAAARGQYLVEDVAMCGTCHTPRLAGGQVDRSRWLSGAPVPYQPSRPTADWPTVAPRIAGLPPASVDGMVTLLTTGIWIDGKQLRDPMPRFHMTKSDAEAVVVYLKSLTPQQ